MSPKIWCIHNFALWCCDAYKQNLSITFDICYTGRVSKSLAKFLARLVEWSRMQCVESDVSKAIFADTEKGNFNFMNFFFFRIFRMQTRSWCSNEIVIVSNVDRTSWNFHRNSYSSKFSTIWIHRFLTSKRFQMPAGNLDFHLEVICTNKIFHALLRPITNYKSITIIKIIIKRQSQFVSGFRYVNCLLFRT